MSKSKNKTPSSRGDSMELSEFYDRFMKTSGALDSLRKLYYLIHSNQERLLPEEVTLALVSTLCNNGLESPVRELCSLILQESMPNNALNLQDLQVIYDTEFSIDTINQLLIIEQEKSTINDGSKWFLKLFGLSTSSNTSFVLALKSTQGLTQMMNYLPKSLFNSDRLDTLCRRLNTRLKMELFSGTRLPATAAISSEIVTILSTQSVSDEYIFNVETFSSLPQIWNVLFNDKVTTMSQTTMELLFTIVDYCVAIVEAQNERGALKNNEATFQKTCLIEAVTILDRACTSDQQFVIRVFPIIRRIHEQSDDLLLSTGTLQFMINHNEHIAYIPSSELEHFFNEIVCSDLENLNSSYGAILFLANNLERFNSSENSPLCVWFPNFMKLLAWFPVTFSAEFIEFIPTFLRADTAVEVLHCILDLPCLTAVLIITMQASQINPLIMQSYGTPSAKAMLKFVLRKSTGSGETLDRLNDLHKLLQPFSSHPRVIMAAQIVIPLLTSFFDVMHDFCDENLAARLVPVILERTNNLLGVAEFGREVRCLLADELLIVFQRNPKLVVENRTEVMEFLSTSGHLHVAMFNKLVWSVGQYVSSNYYPDLLPDTVRGYYEILECIVYEHLGLLSPQTISISLATLVKLASRCQDVVPRVLLCLGKIDHFAQGAIESEWSVVSLRIEEFVAVLREPNVASAALSPIPGNLIERQHLDNMSLPSLWRATNQIISDHLQNENKQPATSI